MNSLALKHEPALDGVRALSVLAVLVFHAVPHWLPGGFLGVDVFFALSGYLITGILLQDYQKQGRICWTRFMLRRWWRLGPALVLMLLVYFMMVMALRPPETWLARGSDVLLALSYASNWARALAWHAPLDLGHTWSLAVEMQFYLIWPLVLVGILKCSPKISVRLGLVLLLALGSWALRVYMQSQGAMLDRIYNGTDTRAETLLWGSALALAMAYVPACQTPRAHDRWLSWLVPVLLLAGLFWADWTHEAVYSIGITAVSVLAVMWIRGVHTGFWSVHVKWLRAWPLVLLGQMSYGVYLWHFPIIRGLLEWGLGGWTMVFWTLVITLLVARVSRVYVELPLMARRDRSADQRTKDR